MGIVYRRSLFLATNTFKSGLEACEFIRHPFVSAHVERRQGRCKVRGAAIFFSSSSFRGKFTRCVIISYSDLRFIFGLLIDGRV
jgi:hypothetical protein